MVSCCKVGLDPRLRQNSSDITRAGLSNDGQRTVAVDGLPLSAKPARAARTAVASACWPTLSRLAAGLGGGGWRRFRGGPGLPERHRCAEAIPGASLRWWATQRQIVSYAGGDFENAVLDRMLEATRSGRSDVLVLRGEPGIGKSALLNALVARVNGYHVTRAIGVESEMEMSYSGLHQLCQPFLDHMDRLPRPQHEALGTVFGLQTGPPPIGS